MWVLVCSRPRESGAAVCIGMSTFSFLPPFLSSSLSCHSDTLTACVCRESGPEMSHPHKPDDHRLCQSWQRHTSALSPYCGCFLNVFVSSVSFYLLWRTLYAPTLAFCFAFLEDISPEKFLLPPPLKANLLPLLTRFLVRFLRDTSEQVFILFVCLCVMVSFIH